MKRRKKVAKQCYIKEKTLLIIMPNYYSYSNCTFLGEKRAENIVPRKIFAIMALL